MNISFKSGFAAILGRPNAGKSTLLNCLLKEKVAIISSKPQTTRNKILGILNEDDCQIAFIDTPGIHSPKTKLGEYMRKSAETAAFDVDCTLFMVSAAPNRPVRDDDKEIFERLLRNGIPVILIINKIDLCEKPEILGEIEKYKDFGFKAIVPISALKDENTAGLLEAVKSCLLPGPKYFPENMITDQPERHIAAEMIREKALFLLRDEIPHGIAVLVTSMKKRETGKHLVDIDAEIYCERDSHKGMIIGKNGEMLKKIGKLARTDMERFFDTKINLQLWVKIKKDWRDNEVLVKNFGYDVKQI